MSEHTVTMILWGIFASLIGFAILFIRHIRTPKGRKSLGGGMVVAVMFGFAKIIEPSRVDVEEARPKKREGENPDTTLKPLLNIK